MAALPRVYIIGGGFAGIQAARALRRAPVEVTLIDRRNHHLFQPLLYQVATASLSPADIAMPIRRILRGQQNARVILAEVTSVDLNAKLLHFPGGAVEYDYLILAAGATHSYFGHDDWAAVAPGLKTLEDATTIRKRILLAFESAEYEGNIERRTAALTFAIVGGGPTGVELAGAIQEIAAKSIPKDFHYIDTTTTRVVLLQAGDRVLPSFPPALSARAQSDLEAMGVEVKLNSNVTNITRDGVYVGEEFLAVRNVFWAAGVKASPLGASLGVPLDKAGRVIANPDLSVPNHPNVFVCGDLAAVRSADTGKDVPGVAQGGMQMGLFAGKIIARETSGKSAPKDRPAFSYHDKGNMATIGKARAVAQIGRLHMSGLPAWLAWGLIHVLFLVGFRNRAFVLLSWLGNWIINARDARLITGEARIDVQTPRPGELILAEQGKAEKGQPANPVNHAPNAPNAPLPPTEVLLGEPKS